MPKTKLDKLSKPKDPPIDWLWAAVLERKMVKNLDLREMAEMVDISYEYMRSLIRKYPWEWPYVMRVKICEVLGLHIELTPSNITEAARGSTSCVRHRC